MDDETFGLPDRYATALLRMMVPVAALSAFLSNTMLTMLFGNVLKRWARKLNVAPSKLYLPMVYAVQIQIHPHICSTVPHHWLSGAVRDVV